MNVINVYAHNGARRGFANREHASKIVFLLIYTVSSRARPGSLIAFKTKAQRTQCECRDRRL